MVWWVWVALGLALTAGGMVLACRALLAHYSRPFVGRLVTGFLLVIIGAGVGTLPIGFPESTGELSAFHSTEGCR